MPLVASFVAGVLLLLPTSVRAAEDDFQIWPVVTLNHGLGQHWGMHLMIRPRFDDDVSRTKDFLVRPFVTWTPFESLTLDLGYDYLHSFQSRSEHRVWQAAEHRFGWRDFTVKNRIRLDQRLVEDVDGPVLRFRYRLRATHPIADSKWYAVLSDEVFTNLNDQGAGPISGFEQNRLRVAAGVRYLGRLRTESGYEWQYAESRSTSSVNRHVFFVEFTIDTGSGPILPWSPR